MGRFLLDLQRQIVRKTCSKSRSSPLHKTLPCVHKLTLLTFPATQQRWRRSEIPCPGSTRSSPGRSGNHELRLYEVLRGSTRDEPSDTRATRTKRGRQVHTLITITVHAPRADSELPASAAASPRPPTPHRTDRIPLWEAGHLPRPEPRGLWRVARTRPAQGPPRGRVVGTRIKRKAQERAHPTCRAGNSANSTRAWRSCTACAVDLHGQEADRRRGRGGAQPNHARSSARRRGVQPSSTSHYLAEFEAGSGIAI